MKNLAGWIQTQGGWSALVEGCGECDQNKPVTLIHTLRGGATVLKYLTLVVFFCLLLAASWDVLGINHDSLPHSVPRTS